MNLSHAGWFISITLLAKVKYFFLLLAEQKNKAECTISTSADYSLG